MWLLFFSECAAALFFIYGFGYLLAKPFKLPAVISICAAPILMMITLFLVSAFFSAAGVLASGKRIVAVSALIAIASYSVCWAIRKRCKSRALRGKREGRSSCRGQAWLAITVLVASAVGAYVYLMPLDSAASFFQGYDNYYHLSQVRSYLNDGCYVSFPITSYPNLWHCLVSVLASAFSQTDGAQICVAANAVNYILSSFVMPSGLFSLMVSILDDGEEGFRLFPFVSLAVSSSCLFPWNFLCQGPLYALLAGWSVLVFSMSVFVMVVRRHGKGKGSFIRGVLLFVITLFGLLVGHPSTFFSAIVFLAPFCTGGIYKWVYAKTHKRGSAAASASLFVAFVLAVWCFCLNSPLFSDLLAFNWPKVSSFSTALFGAALLAVRPSLFPQIAIAACVLIGSIYCMLEGKNRWLIVSYLIISVLYAVCVGGSGYAVKIASGFWYSDGNRMAAMLGFASIPLVTYGLFASYLLLNRAAEIILPNEKMGRGRRSAAALMVVLIPYAVLNYCPSFQLAGVGTFQTGYGYLRDRLVEYNALSDDAFCYSGDEIDFVDRVKEIVGDSKVANYPYDGSCFSYALNNVNVMYRFWYVADLDTSVPSNLVRMGVNEVGDNALVQKACADEGVDYVMILDYGHLFGAGVFNYSHRVDDAWAGLTSVTDNMPGLQLVLQEGDKRLYRIVSMG